MKKFTIVAVSALALGAVLLIAFSAALYIFGGSWAVGSGALAD